jgi:sugar phosphate isomerase/epimerase
MHTMKFPIALQMYTVRNELEKDYLGSFRRIAEIGYQGVELELPPPELSLSQVKSHLAQSGLIWVGCHVEYEQVSTQLDKLLDSLNEAGCKNLVLSYLEYHSFQDVIDAAKRFNQIGETCKSRGIQFLYHNHNHEFQQYDGSYVLDILLKSTDPELVKFEMDTYWVQRAGIDPAEYLHGLQNRCPLLHIKDMEPGPEQFFAEIGEGILDFHAIFNEAKFANVQWLIVEQDECRKPAFESITISYRNLKQMIM